MAHQLIKQQLILVGLLFGFFFSTSSFAETIKFEDLAFEVEQLRELSDGSVQVKIAGQDFLLDAEGWRRQALRLCLVNSCDSLKPDEVMQFALDYQQSPAVDEKLLKAINFYFRRTEASEGLIEKLRYDLISAYAQSEKSGVAFLRRVCFGQIQFPSICDSLTILSERFDTALKLINAGRAEGVLLLISGLRGSDEIQPLIGPIVRSLKSLSGSKESAKVEQIVKVLALIPTELVTQDLLEFFHSQLVELKQNSVDPQLFERLVSAHIKVIESNKSFAEDLEEVVSEQVEQNFKKGEPERSKMFLGSWLVLASRPEFLSTSSLLQLYIWLNRFGESDKAEKIYSQVAGKLGLFDRLRLFFVRHFPSVNYVVLVVLVVLLSLTLLVVILTKRKLEDETLDFDANFAAANDEPEQPKVFSVGALAISPRMLRYKECLRIIGLSGPATVRDIKAAYRAAVKESHPDLKADNGSQSAGQSKSDRFIELTQAYDEALVLHAEIGSDEEAI